MPLPNRNIQPHNRSTRPQLDGLSAHPVRRIKLFHQPPPQTNHRLGTGTMPMNRQRAPRLNRIQHPLISSPPSGKGHHPTNHHRPTLQILQAMPLPLLYFQHYPTRHHIYGISEITILIIEIHLKKPTDPDTRFIRTLMLVYRHHHSPAPREKATVPTPQPRYRLRHRATKPPVYPPALSAHTLLPSSPKSPSRSPMP